MQSRKSSEKRNPSAVEHDRLIRAGIKAKAIAAIMGLEDETSERAPPRQTAEPDGLIGRNS